MVAGRGPIGLVGVQLRSGSRLKNGRRGSRHRSARSVKKKSDTVGSAGEPRDALHSPGSEDRLQDMRQALPAPGTADASRVSPPMPRMITEQAGAARPGGIAGAGGTNKAEAAIGQSSTHPMKWDCLQDMRQALPAPGAPHASAASSLQIS